MTHDWLLVETLGTEPAVVAQGRQTKNLVPISAFLRRSPHLMAIQTAISETVRTGQSMSTITPRNDRVIRTEPVRMSDGRIHGVQVWIGPPNVEPPERPIPGPIKWDLTAGVATDTPESLANSGQDPAKETTHGRAFAEDLPVRALNPGETKVLSMMINSKAGMTLSDTWDVNDYRGEPIAVGFVSRTAVEKQEDGSERTICRAMNWRAEREGGATTSDLLAQRIIDGLTLPGVHRALVDPVNWTLLKWLDKPAPFFDWRVGEPGVPSVNPADARHIARMAAEYANGVASGVLRVRSPDGGWIPVHLTVNKVQIDDDTFAGLMAVRLPTEAELAALECDEAPAPDESPSARIKKAIARKAKARREKTADPVPPEG